MLDLDRILRLSQEMDDAPELSTEQATQLAHLFSPDKSMKQRDTHRDPTGKTA